MTSRTFMHVTWDGAGMNRVEAALFEELVQRGHTVTVLGPRSVEPLYRRAGCDFVLDPSASSYSSATDFPDDELVWLRDNIWLGRSPESSASVITLASRLHPDAVTISTLFIGAMAGVEACGRPSAGLAASLPGAERPTSRDDPELQFFEGGLVPLNRARTGLGLRPLTSVFDQLDALDRILILSVIDLHDPAVPLAANSSFAGPTIRARRSERSSGEPVVLVSFSTGNMAQAPVMQQVLDALRTLPMHGVLTLGPAISRNELRIPPNVATHEDLPHTDVLPKASVVVTHGGHGTVMAALAHAVPILCLPLGRDQPYVAGRVAAAGAGLVLKPDAEPSEIAAAVSRLAGEPSFRANAERICEAIAAYHGQAVRELEALAAGRT